MVKVVPVTSMSSWVENPGLIDKCFIKIIDHILRQTSRKRVIYLHYLLVLIIIYVSPSDPQALASFSLSSAIV